jgi:hypothetical protein
MSWIKVLLQKTMNSCSFGWKSVFAITFLLVILLEIFARFFIFISYGTSIAGLPERTTYLNYRSFTMWGKNIPKEAQEYSGIQRPDNFRIMILGGSVAAGFEPYHEVLAETFSEFTVSSGKSASIFNAANGGFNSRQQAIALMLSVETINPDLIVVLDGANDLSHSLRRGSNPETTYVDKHFSLILAYPYLAPLIDLLQRSQLYNGMLRIFERNYFEAKDDAKLRHAERIYLDTRNFVHFYAKGRGIPVVFILQPYVGFSRAAEDNLARERFKHREKSLLESFERVSGSSNALCFADSNQDIKSKELALGFSDDVHFKDDRGYRYLSSLIARQASICYPYLKLLS